jgi:hypothetical protein
MLVTFKSTATESITMFKDAAVELLRLMGATGPAASARTTCRKRSHSSNPRSNG